MILTTFSEKRGCATTNSCNKGGSAGFIIQIIPQSIHSCSSSLNSREARLGNILNTYSRFSKVLDVDFLQNHSPAFETSLDSRSKLNIGGN